MIKIVSTASAIEDLNAIGESLDELPKAKEEKEIGSRYKLTLFRRINK